MKTAVERDPDLTPNTLTAIRAVSRLWRQYMDSGERVWSADRQFDGGEWSDHAIELMQLKEEERIVDMVGERFGIETFQLQTLWDYNYYYDQMICWETAMRRQA